MALHAPRFDTRIMSRFVTTHMPREAHMSAATRLEEDLALAPGWLSTEMPPGYHNRVAEIQRLTEELRSLERFGHLLWRVGDDLAIAVRATFAAFGFEAALTPDAAARSVMVELGDGRLLLHVSATEDVIQKKDAELAHVFQKVHELAADTDRVVLVTNNDLRARPMDRTESVGPEALNLLRRLGVNVLAAPTLFALWRLSVQDRERARSHIERLYTQDGGAFVLPQNSVTRS
jgi:hypothetical protein